MTISFWRQAHRLGVARIFLRQRAIALQPFLAPRLPGWPLALGDDAYAIFLIHGFVVPVAYVVALYAGLAGGSLLLGVLVTALVASALVSQLTHTYGERSAMFLLRRRSRFQFVAVAD